MADRKKEVDWPLCQLMLVIEPGPGARDRLRAALDAGTVAAVLIRPKAGDRLGAGEVKPLVDVAQDRGAAAIVYNDVEMARTLGADGVHLAAGLDVRERVAGALSALGDEASVGVDAGGSRHAAMEAGEAGAAYVAFGVRDIATDADGQQHDLVAWWADIFELPCVALDLASVDDVVAANANGADFAALTLPLAGTPTAVAALVSAVDAKLAPDDRGESRDGEE